MAEFDHASSPAFLDLRAAARWSSLSIRTLRRIIKRGLPTYRTGVGGKILIRPAELAVFLTREVVAQPDLNSLVEQITAEITAERKNQ